MPAAQGPHVRIRWQRYRAKRTDRSDMLNLGDPLYPVDSPREMITMTFADPATRRLVDVHKLRVDHAFKSGAVAARRWHNQLCPKLKRGSFEPEEDRILAEVRGKLRAGLHPQVPLKCMQTTPQRD